MKKSYDYFKMLKNMSECVAEAFLNSVNAKGSQSVFIKFSGIKSELSENLIDEFVAPIERDDIFRLSFCLYEELWCIDCLFSVPSVLDCNNCFFERFLSALKKQTEAFSAFGEIKSPQKLFKTVSETNLLCNRLKNEVISNLPEILQKSSQPLLNYSVICAELELLKAISTTSGELERVVINNN